MTSSIVSSSGLEAWTVVASSPWSADVALSGNNVIVRDLIMPFRTSYSSAAGGERKFPSHSRAGMMQRVPDMVQFGAITPAHHSIRRNTKSPDPILAPTLTILGINPHSRLLFFAIYVSVLLLCCTRGHCQRAR